MRTLVLNAGYEPLSVVSFKRAVVLVMNHKATVLESDNAHPVRSVSGEVERPSVIILTHYVHVPHGRSVPVSRRGVLRRDFHRCAYCGKSASTVDHVVPRSRGGRDSWENLVACCLRCNNVKGNKTLAEMGWDLAVSPMPPRDNGWVVRGTESILGEWEDYLPHAA